MGRPVRVAAALVLLALLAGCNTWEGVRQDAKAGAEAIERTATKVKNKL
ncbi:hypothetical protein [Azospirillum sp. sgz301742]